MSVNKEYAKTAALLAGGAIIGAALGLLFAPQTGAATRRTIQRYAKRAQVEVGRFGRDVKAKMVTKKDEGQAIKAA
jgi:gas vesicle protein